jgi:replicative DNA helicase
MTDDRLPPHNLEAERGVLGALLREGTAADGTFGHLTPADFYLYPHQLVYAVFHDYAAAGKPFDCVTLFDELIRRNQSKDVGPGYVAELFDSVPTAANLEHHAQIVREYAERRRLIHAATELVRDAFDGTAQPLDLLERFYDSAVQTADACGRDPVTLTTALREVMSEIDERMRPGGRRPLTTGFDSLDNVLGGWRGGEFIVLGARPSQGKTALAVSFLLAAAEAGIPSLMFSLEMSATEVASRVLAMRSDVPLNQIRGRLADERNTVHRLIDAVDSTRLPAWIDDRPDHTVASITSVSKRAVRKHKVGLVVIDYLQLMNHEGGKQDTQSIRVGNTSRRLKLLARSLNVPVVCLAQLNRECESRGDKRPNLSDFRESGSIEQDCDVAMMLWPDDTTVSPHDPLQTIRVCVEKQRNGPRTVVPLDYRRAVVRFEQGRVGY